MILLFFRLIGLALVGGFLAFFRGFIIYVHYLLYGSISLYGYWVLYFLELFKLMFLVTLLWWFCVFVIMILKQLVKIQNHLILTTSYLQIALYISYHFVVLSHFIFWWLNNTYIFSCAFYWVDLVFQCEGMKLSYIFDNLFKWQFLIL